MKKKFIATLMCTLILSSNAFAEENIDSAQNLYSTYSQYVTIENDSDIDNLSLETAVSKVISNSSSLKKLESSMELSEYDLDIQTLSYESGEMSSIISKQVSLKNDEISMETQEESLAFSVKEMFIDIITNQRDLEVLEESLALEELELRATELKHEMGLVSSTAFSDAKLSYETSLQNYENTLIDLESSYISLNMLMGVNLDNRYSFELPLEYEVLDIEEYAVDSYIIGAVSENPDIKQQENSLYSAEYNVFTSASSTEVGAYDSAKNNVANAEMTLADTEEKLEDDYRILYNTIIQSEISLTTLLNEFENEKIKLDSYLIQYQLGSISEIDYEQHLINIAKTENEIVSAIYKHMLNTEQFNNTNLM